MKPPPLSIRTETQTSDVACVLGGAKAEHKLSVMVRKTLHQRCTAHSAAGSGGPVSTDCMRQGGVCVGCVGG